MLEFSSVLKYNYQIEEKNKYGTDKHKRSDCTERASFVGKLS